MLTVCDLSRSLTYNMRLTSETISQRQLYPSKVCDEKWFFVILFAKWRTEIGICVISTAGGYLLVNSTVSNNVCTSSRPLWHDHVVA